MFPYVRLQPDVDRLLIVSKPDEIKGRSGFTSTQHAGPNNDGCSVLVSDVDSVCTGLEKGDLERRGLRFGHKLATYSETNPAALKMLQRSGTLPRTWLNTSKSEKNATKKTTRLGATSQTLGYRCLDDVKMNPPTNWVAIAVVNTTWAVAKLKPEKLFHYCSSHVK